MQGSMSRIRPSAAANAAQAMRRLFHFEPRARNRPRALSLPAGPGEVIG